MISEMEGEFLVKLVRKTIETYIKDGTIIDDPKETPKNLKEDIGVFVTLYSRNQLRGCIGYPEPVKPLVQATIDVAIGAATQDPRFPPLNVNELADITVEVSVLTPPKSIEVSKSSEYLEKVTIGVDGLIVEMGVYRGLLLPQVPLEWGWDVEEFLGNTCMKAGLSLDCWLREGVKIYSFQSQIFEEKK
jgi:uncharacterized protein (TIGR00296 family)